MRSECTAPVPQSICSYTWKASATPRRRPALSEDVREAPSQLAEKGEHASIPWKAYLAAREFQTLASDLAEGLFSSQASAALPDLAVPAILKSDACAAAGAAGRPSSELLTPVLLAGENASAELRPTRQAFDFAVAA
jgi:hypothetical protein